MSDTRNDVVSTVGELAEADPRGAVWCAVVCARTAADRSPEATHRLELAARWARGEDVPQEEMGDALRYRNGDTLTAAGQADVAARYVLVACDPSYSHYVREAVKWTASSQGTSAVSEHDEWRQIEEFDDAEGRHLGRLADLVDEQLRPIDERSTPLGDWLEENSEAERVGTLGDALDRARQADLRWEIPEERALAERFAEVPEAAQALVAKTREDMAPTRNRLTARRGARSEPHNDPSR